MRGMQDLNYPAFNEAAAALRNLGFHVFNPAEFDDLFGAAEPGDNHTYIRRDLHVIINEMRPPDDYLVLLPGWEHSIGAFAEVGVARWCGLKIVHLWELIRRDIAH